jgi:hypothetical protein
LYVEEPSLAIKQDRLKSKWFCFLETFSFEIQQVQPNLGHLENNQSSSWFDKFLTEAVPFPIF